MDKKLRQGGLIFLDEGGSDVSREMTCEALEGWRANGMPGRGYYILGQGAWAAGQKQGPAEKGRTACWGKGGKRTRKGQRPEGRGEWPAGRQGQLRSLAY